MTSIVHHLAGSRLSSGRRRTLVGQMPMPSEWHMMSPVKNFALPDSDADHTSTAVSRGPDTWIVNVPTHVIRNIVTQPWIPPYMQGRLITAVPSMRVNLHQRTELCLCKCFLLG
jgi:hypothetical protein